MSTDLTFATILFGLGLALMQFKGTANVSALRLTRLVPPLTEAVDTTIREGKILAICYSFLKFIDPSFAPTETMLRSLGVNRLQWLVAIEGGKIAGALVSAFLCYRSLGILFPYAAAKAVLPLMAFLLSVVGINKVITSASLNRRRAMRRELALGMELLCVFLEGGQSLDQAFRSFCDVCSQALPHIASVQRILVADINNGLAYEKAVQRWVENIGVEEVKPLSSLFIDSLMHGTELVPHLRQFANDLTEQRIVAGRASIGAKSSQLTVVMVLFFLPAILGFVTAPTVMAAANALGAPR